MLFQIYGETAGFQLLGWLMVFAGLILANEFARRTKWGGIACFLVLPAGLTAYFISIYVGAAMGAEWALNNPTYVYMNSWFHYFKLYAAVAGCIGFMMIKYQWGIGKKEWFKVFPFLIVAANILIAVVSDFESAIKGAMSVDGWWLSSENVWLYGGWIQNRANTLGLWCMFAQVFPLFQDRSIFTTLPALYADGFMDAAIRPTLVNPVPQGVISIVSLAINVLVLALIIKRSVEQKKNPYKKELFTDTKDFQLALARAEDK